MGIPVPASTTPLTAGSQAKLYIKARLDNTPWSEDDAVPLARELGFTPTGAITVVPLFGEEFDRAVKTGKGGTLMIGTVAPDSHPVVDILLDAGDAVGPNAQVKFLVVNPDKRAYVGYTVVEAGTGQYDARNVFGYSINTTLDGKYQPFKLLDGDVAASIPPTAITIAPDPAAVTVGATTQLTGPVTPSGARQNVVWSTANPARATVSGTGLVTGVSAGTVVITAASAYDGTVTDTVTVTVS